MGWMGCQTPKTAPSPWARGPHLLHPCRGRPHSPSQTACRSNQPFCHSTLSGQTDQQTDRWTHTHTQTDRWARRQVRNMSAYAHYIDSDVLKIEPSRSESDSAQLGDLAYASVCRCMLWRSKMTAWPYLFTAPLQQRVAMLRLFCCVFAREFLFIPNSILNLTISQESQSFTEFKIHSA